MPQRIFCSKCSHPLYQGVELETPVEVIQRNGGYCPKCGKRLAFEVENLKIGQSPNAGPPFQTAAPLPQQQAQPSPSSPPS